VEEVPLAEQEMRTAVTPFADAVRRARRREEISDGLRRDARTGRQRKRSAVVAEAVVPPLRVLRQQISAADGEYLRGPEQQRRRRGLFGPVGQEEQRLVPHHVRRPEGAHDPPCVGVAACGFPGGRRGQQNGNGTQQDGRAGHGVFS